MAEAAKQVCFVDMPFGRKVDPKSGVEIDFDGIYDNGIKPAIEAAGLAAVRGDQEETGGIIHTAMFARLLLAEFVVADMTTANPNVFYELGIRHAAKPYTTIPLFATLGAPPFDVNMVRAIPYDLEEGVLTDKAAEALKTELARRIERALKGPVAKDSPLFDLFPKFPGIELSHELTDVFRDRVAYSAGLRNKLAAARATKPRNAALQSVREILRALGDPRNLERGVLVDVYLSFRALEAWDDMVALYEAMPADAQVAAIVRQQLAFALNRRNGPGDRDRAVSILERLIRDQGDSAETLGILGRIYKDRWREAKAARDPAAPGWLEQAIDAYRRGFEAEPADYYPGVNAIALLLQQGDGEAQAEIDRLAPIVTFAAVRRGGAKASDYWTVATVLELACVSRDYGLAERCLPRALSLAHESFMPKTTAENLRQIETLRAAEDGIGRVGGIARALETKADQLRGDEPEH